MVYRKINKRKAMLEIHSDEQNSWEDSLEKDMVPKFRFPVSFTDDSIDSLNLDFPKIKLKVPKNPKIKIKLQW